MKTYGYFIQQWYALVKMEFDTKSSLRDANTFPFQSLSKTAENKIKIKYVILRVLWLGNKSDPEAYK